jgi:hypothetical protein
VHPCPNSAWNVIAGAADLWRCRGCWGLRRGGRRKTGIASSRLASSRLAQGAVCAEGPHEQEAMPHRRSCLGWHDEGGLSCCSHQLDTAWVLVRGLRCACYSADVYHTEGGGCSVLYRTPAIDLNDTFNGCTCWPPRDVTHHSGLTDIDETILDNWRVSAVCRRYY